MGSQRVLASLMVVLSLAPVAALAASFDAIVIDDDLRGGKGDGSYAVGQGTTRQDAERIAMGNCTLGGNVNCKVKVTYRQCGAYASSGRVGGAGVGSSMAQASASALSRCHDQACRIVVADCVDQPLAPPR